MANEKAGITPGQGFYAPGYVPRQSLFKDSTRLASITANQEFVMGCPIGLGGSGVAADQGKLISFTTDATDGFYGLAGQNINSLRGRTSLGEQKNLRMNAELQGIFTIRRSVLLDAAGAEQTISPFTGFSGANGFPVAADEGKLIDAIEVTSEAALGSVTMLKWGTGGGSNTGFADIAIIVAVRETDEEVDIYLPGKLVARATNV
jgi:hypothetical protein